MIFHRLVGPLMLLSGVRVRRISCIDLVLYPRFVESLRAMLRGGGCRVLGLYGIAVFGVGTRYFDTDTRQCPVGRLGEGWSDFADLVDHLRRNPVGRLCVYQDDCWSSPSGTNVHPTGKWIIVFPYLVRRSRIKWGCLPRLTKQCLKRSLASLSDLCANSFNYSPA